MLAKYGKLVTETCICYPDVSSEWQRLRWQCEGQQHILRIPKFQSMLFHPHKDG